MRPASVYRKRPITHEDTAWREIAEAFAEPPSDNGTRLGLCYAVATMYVWGRITPALHGRMLARVDAHLPMGYAYEPVTAAREAFIPHREARCLAALWLALESQHVK